MTCWCRHALSPRLFKHASTAEPDSGKTVFFLKYKKKTQKQWYLRLQYFLRCQKTVFASKNNRDFISPRKPRSAVANAQFSGAFLCSLAGQKSLSGRHVFDDFPARPVARLVGATCTGLARVSPRHQTRRGRRTQRFPPAAAASPSRDWLRVSLTRHISAILEPFYKIQNAYCNLIV